MTEGMREHQRYAERINTAKEVLQEAHARPEPFSPNAYGYTYVRPRRARTRVLPPYALLTHAALACVLFE